MDPSTLISSASFDMGAAISQIIFWLGITLFALIFFGAGLFFLYFMGFPMRMKIIKLTGDVHGGFAFDKIVENKYKWNKDKTAWKPLWPLMNKIEIKPFDSKHSYKGNQIIAFEVAGQLKPAKLALEDGELKVLPVEYHIRQWQSLQHKRNAEEFAEKNFWEDNKQFFMVILTAGFCLVLVGLTVYFTYKFATAGSGEIRSLAEAIRSLGNIAGKPAG